MLGSETGGEDIFGDGKTGLENLNLEVALLGGREPVADNLAGTFTFKTVSPGNMAKEAIFALFAIFLRNLTGFSKNYCPAASRHNAGMTFSI